MKQVICPKCGKTFSFDESRYDASCNISFICPACRKRFLMTLPEIDACHKNDIDTSLGFITVLENAFGYRQEFPLHAGDNIIGRAFERYGSGYTHRNERHEHGSSPLHYQCERKRQSTDTHGQRQSQSHRHIPPP